MTDPPSDVDPPCHNMTERECKLIKRIDQAAQMYDQLERLIQELADATRNNDWYFLTHSNQIQEDAKIGRKQRELYLETLESDSNRYIHEIKHIKMLIRRAIEAAPIREIRIIEDDSDSDALTP